MADDEKKTLRGVRIYISGPSIFDPQVIAFKQGARAAGWETRQRAPGDPLFNVCRDVMVSTIVVVPAGKGDVYDEFVVGLAVANYRDIMLIGPPTKYAVLPGAQQVTWDDLMQSVQAGIVRRAHFEKRAS